jgi:peptide/nickel transport system permease protein
MFKFIVRRLLLIPIILFGVSLLIFSLISLMKPLDRAIALFPRDMGSQRDFEGLISKYGLDAPIHIQYWEWMVGKEDPDTGEMIGGVLSGNLGWSQIGRSPVSDIISSRLPATAELLLWSAVPMIGFGIWLGMKAAVSHNKFTDHLLRISAVSAWSIPAFTFGLLMLLVFASQLKWLPPGRLSIEARDIVQSVEFINYTKMYTIDALLNLRFDVFEDAIKHLILPIATLSAANWAFLLRVTRSSMLDTARQEYITTARSKGLSEEWITRKHALPNALIPVISVGGLILVSLFNSIVVTETIFNYPGLGSFVADSALALDLVSIAGVTIFSSLVLIVGNLVVDVLYTVIDPRIRFD